MALRAFFTGSIISFLSVLSYQESHATTGEGTAMSCGSHRSQVTNVYIDKEVRSFPHFGRTTVSGFHLVSHGRPGYLLLDGKWRNAQQIASFLQMHIAGEASHLYIYGCAFGKGAAGRKAVAYLEQALGVVVSASDDITGLGGDWDLEVGAPVAVKGLESYAGNLQCTYGSYLVPHTVSWVSNGNLDGYTSISENIQNNTGGKLYSDGANVIYASDSGFKAGDVITIRGNYQNDSRRGPLVLTSAGSTALNSGPVMDNAFPANAWGDVTYIIPAGTPVFNQLNITGATQNGVYVNIDAVSVSRSACYTCNINIAPVLSATTITIACPDTTYNLNSITAGNTPAGAELTWHTGKTATDANRITDPAAATDVNGRFYAAFRSTANGCYSGINGTATTLVLADKDSDCDGVANNTDIDDDNDGVLDKEEQECVVADYNTNASSAISNIFSKNGMTAGVTLFDQLAEETGLVFAADSTFSSGISLANACSEPALYGGGWSGDIWIRSVDPMNISRAVPLYSITLKGDCAGANEYATYSAYGQQGNLLYTYDIAANIPQVADQVFDLVMNPGYNVYSIRIKRIASAAVVAGIMLKEGFGVTLCDIDIDDDNDGVPNRIDLDSDGDGCTDTKEAILYSNSDVPTQPGAVQNGSGGSVTSTVTTAEARVPGPYGANGFADILQSAADSNKYRYLYTYLHVATHAFNNACIDLDNDDVPDFSEDLDQDDDGIPNAVESPSCFFTQLQAIDITEGVTSGFGWSGTNPLSRTYDDNTTTYGEITSTANILNKPLITFDLPVIATDILDTVVLNVGSTAFGSGTWHLEGRTSMSVWDTLSPDQPMNSANASYRFVNTLQPAKAYHMYRIIGSSSANITNSAKLREFSIHYKNYNASKHPSKAGCTSDTDNDGSPDFYDRDSDGDGCPDAVEGGVSGVLLPGEIHSNAADSMVVANAIAAGPYGHNGLADGVETAPESGMVNYISTFNLYATAATLNACLDSDKDGIRDVTDIDDDNDGVVDREEGNCVVNNTRKTGITVTKPATINYTFDGSQTLANLIDSIDGNDYIMRSPSGTLNNSEWFRVELSTPKILTQWEVGQYTSQPLFTTGSTYKIQGSHNGTGWTDLTGTLTYGNNQTGQSTQAHSNIAGFPQNATAYKYYRYFGISATSGGGWATEFYFKESKCADKDTDSDNIPDRLDLDSDGDGCPDAREAGVSDNPGASGAMSASGDSLYSGGIAAGTANAYTGNGTPSQYGANGYFNGIETSPESGVYNGVSTYGHYALAGNRNLCADTDNDNVPDLTDLDDDNDGILDAVESPACFFTAAELKTSATYSSDFTFSAAPNALSSIHDNNTATYGQIPAATNIAAKALYRITLPTSAPQRIVSITDSVGATAFGSGTWILQGSGNGVAWDTLSAAQAMNAANTKYTFANTLKPGNAYSQYRLVGATGTNSTANAKLQEIQINYADYTPSRNPRHACDADTDFDGVLNHLDLDSDGDKCPDAYEAGTYNRAGVSTSNGNVQNGSGGIVTATMPTANALINGPYGGNGFADVLQAAADTNSYKYVYTYNKALDTAQKACCIAGNTAPVLTKMSDTVCGSDVYNLNSVVSGTAPAYNTLAWFTDNAHTNVYSTPATAVAGVYYAFYKDTINNCFSPASPAFTLASKPLPAGSASPQAICSGSTSGVALHSTISGAAFTWTAVLESGSVTGFSNCTSGCGSVIAQTLTGEGVVRYAVTPVANGCAGNVFTVDITVAALPVTTIAYSGSPYSSGSGTAGVTQSGQNGGVYSATPSGLSIDAATGLVDINNSFADTYTVKYIYSDSICTDSAMTTLIIVSTNDTAATMPACPTCPVTVCAVADDVDTTGGAAYSTPCGTPPGYTAGSIGADGCITYTPSGMVTDTAEACIVTCNNGKCDTTKVILYPPVPTSDTVMVIPDCPTCPVTVCAVADDVDTTGGAVYSTPCGIPSGYTAGSIGAGGCITYTPAGMVTDTTEACIVTCNDGRCDTTKVILYPPVPTADTVATMPACPTCPVVVCPVFDDVNAANVSGTAACGAPSGYALAGPDTNGCYTYTPDGTATDTTEACIVVCDGGRCDTTKVILYPPAQTINHDWNVGFVGLTLSGNIATNDQVFAGTTYDDLQAYTGNPTTQLPVLNSNGTYSFTASQTGHYTFSIRVCPAEGSVSCPLQTLFINIADTMPDANAVPIANLDIVKTKYQAPVGIPTLGNDGSGNYGGSLNPGSVVVTDMPDNGVIDSVGANGNIYYRPNAGFTGMDTLVYRVCDQSLPSNCDTAYQIITVLPQGAANTTTASDDYAATLAEMVVAGNVKGNDIDPEHDSLSIMPDTLINASGTFAINDQGNYTYTPAADFVGTAQFAYRLCDNGMPAACAKATVHILVYPQHTQPLPVRIITFSGRAWNNYSNLLTWKVADAKEMDSYGIIRSTDLQSWAPLGRIAAANKSGIQSMQLVDNNPDEANYYRLVLHSQNGKSEIYPKTVYIRRDRKNKEWAKLYPNPAGAVIHLEYYSLKSNAAMQIDLIDMTGRKIRSVKQRLSEGVNLISMDISGMANGIYTIRYVNTANGRVATRTFVKETK